MEKIRKIIDRINVGIRWIAGGLLFFILVITFMQVVLRYVFHSPTMWAGVVAIIMLTWFSYFVISLAVYDGRHISLDFFYLRCKKTTRKALDAVRHVLTASFAGLMVHYGFRAAVLSKDVAIPTIGFLNRGVAYIPLVISGVLIILYSIVNLIDVFTEFDKKEGKG